MLAAALMAMAIAAPSDGTEPGPGAPVLAPLSLSPAQLAPGTLEVFKTLCIANKAQGAAAIRAAEKLNWSAPPASLVSGSSSLMNGMQHVQARMTMDGAATYLLITGDDADIRKTGHPTPNAACMVVGLNVGAADSNLKADTVKWMGAEPTSTNDSLTIYGYTETGGSKTIFKSENEAEQAFDSGKVFFVGLGSDEPLNLLVYVVPTQAN